MRQTLQIIWVQGPTNGPKRAQKRISARLENRAVVNMASVERRLAHGCSALAKRNAEECRAA